LKEINMDKPSVFIGSSTEGLPIAEAVFAALSNETKPKLWTHQLFLPGHYPMESLEEQLRRNAFAILIASPDDQLAKRGVTSAAMRDNILVEFGLFAGALGRRRSFFVCPDSPRIDLPSDLIGLIVGTYDGERVKAGPDEIAAAVQVACQQIRTVIGNEWAMMKASYGRLADRIRASERGKAIERLHSVIIQLRDAVMVVQRGAFAAVSDQKAFDNVKMTAQDKVSEIAASFTKDADVIGILSQLHNLSAVTVDAIADLSFPKELSLGKEAARQKIIGTGFGALDAFLGGRDPFSHLEDGVSQEASMRVSSLTERYIDWWDRHYPKLERATAELQDKLFSAAMQLAVTGRDLASADE
jgi:predicted nucleotide-binding protein with TIR-like domain